MNDFGGLVVFDTTAMTIEQLEKEYVVIDSVAEQGKIYAILNIPTKTLQNASFKVVCFEGKDKT